MGLIIPPFALIDSLSDRNVVELEASASGDAAPRASLMSASVGSFKFRR